MFSSEHLFSIALRRCYMIGDINFQKLIKNIGSAEKVWKLPKKEFKIFGVGNQTIKEIGSAAHLKFAEEELKFCESQNINILLRHQKNFPKLLADCIDAPAILYVKGNLSDNKRRVSMVGTRNATTYGKEFVADFLEAAEHTKIETVSGLAYGIDAQVHQKSLDFNIPTIGVLAHGLHLVYPAKHRILSEQILSKGGVILTEFNSSQKPDKENFIQRNRIIAGLSEATIVVETGFGGGSVSTATFANGYNREVFALPGKISEKYSQGCNHLIYQNKATVISTIKNLLDDLRLTGDPILMPELFPYSEEKILLTDQQEQLLTLINENAGISLDELGELLGEQPFKILPEILQLELLGKIRSNSERRFLVI